MESIGLVGKWFNDWEGHSIWSSGQILAETAPGVFLVQFVDLYSAQLDGGTLKYKTHPAQELVTVEEMLAKDEDSEHQWYFFDSALDAWNDLDRYSRLQKKVPA